MRGLSSLGEEYFRTDRRHHKLEDIRVIILVCDEGLVPSALVELAGRAVDWLDRVHVAKHDKVGRDAYDGAIFIEKVFNGATFAKAESLYVDPDRQRGGVPRARNDAKWGPEKIVGY